MISKIILIIIAIMGILIGAFYYFGGKDYLVKQGCVNDAIHQRLAVKKAEDALLLSGYLPGGRSDYEKIYNNVYKACLQRNGITE